MAAKITPAENGPLIVSEPPQITGSNGETLEQRPRVALCRCGQAHDDEEHRRRQARYDDSNRTGRDRHQADDPPAEAGKRMIDGGGVGHALDPEVDDFGLGRGGLLCEQSGDREQATGEGEDEGFHWKGKMNSPGKKASGDTSCDDFSGAEPAIRLGGAVAAMAAMAEPLQAAPTVRSP